MPVGLPGRVRGDFRTVDRDRAQPGHPRVSAQPQDLREQAGEHLAVGLAEPGQHGVIGHVTGARDPERHIRGAQSLDLAAGALPATVGIQQQPEQHLRVVPGPTGRAAARTAITAARDPGMQRRGVQHRDRVQHEPHQMLIRQPVDHVRR
ncbi:hypothetical protein GCM10009772_24330 [Pseudonocardia alni subsp. carboxydivorans]